MSMTECYSIDPATRSLGRTIQNERGAPLMGSSGVDKNLRSFQLVYLHW